MARENVKKKTRIAVTQTDRSTTRRHSKGGPGGKGGCRRLAGSARAGKRKQNTKIPEEEDEIEGRKRRK
jgi:hypothetical protein